MYGGVYDIYVRCRLMDYYFNILGIHEHLHRGLDTRIPNVEALTRPLKIMGVSEFPISRL